MIGSGHRRPRLAVVLQPRDRLDARGVPSTSVAIVATALAERLAERVEVLLLAPASGPLPERSPAGIPIVPVALPDRRREDLLQLLELWWPSHPPRLAAADYHIGYWREVASALLRYTPDLVHLHAYPQALPVVREALPQARFLLHLHDPLATLVPPSCLGPALALADRILAVSEFLGTRLRGSFPELVSRIAVVPNGIDPRRFSQTPTSPAEPATVLQLGRISPEKGHHVLVRAFARICDRFPAARLLFVGRAGFFPWSYVRLLASDPPMREALAFWGRNPVDRLVHQVLVPGRAYVADLVRLLPPDARSRLAIRPPVGHDAIPELLVRAGLVAVPSVIEEPFGLPAAEAMAAGRPVVASARGGLSECVIHGETGLLVPAGDDRALADALGTLFADPERAREMGERGRIRAEALDWRHSAERLLAICGELLGETLEVAARDR